MGGPPPLHFAGAEPTGTDAAHLPLTHPWPVEQAMGHSPQWALSFRRSTQLLEQMVNPGTQPEEHWPVEQA
jgi:hypothetical protein